MRRTNIPSSQQRILWAALALVAALSSLNSFVNPLFEPPDELQHYGFVRYLVDERRLPIQEQDGQVSQSHQPPLYYLTGALLVARIDDPIQIPPRNPFWAYRADQVNRDNKQQFLNPDSQAFPFQGTALVIHLLRLWSVVLALGTVVVTWKLGCALWPDEPIKVAAMLSLSVLNPMFLYISGATNNDSLVISCGALILWLSVKALKDSFAWKTSLVISLVWACAMLTKITGIIAVAPWSVALACAAWKRRDVRLFATRMTAIAGAALTLTGWWFIRNLLIYGEVLALQRVLAVWGARDQLDLVWIWNDLIYSWTTFWGRFAYGQVPLPSIIYWFFLALTICAIGGLFKLFRGAVQRKEWAKNDWPTWFTLVATSIAFIAGLGYYIVRSPTGANGRYIFPALPALSALLVHGISAWSTQRQQVILGSITIVVIAISLFSIGVFLPWTYARPALLTEEEMLALIETEQDLTWGNGIELVGTAVSPRQVSYEEYVGVTACWLAKAEMSTDYTFYVHLIDHQFHSLGQRDTYTGLGSFPTSHWQPGDLFCDTYQVPVSKELSLPVAADIEIGFYELGSHQHLPVHGSDGIPLERAVVDQIKVMPKSTMPTPEMQEAIGARFDQGLVLTKYNWSATNIRGGETFSVTVAWEAAGPLDHSYTIFAHLLDANGQLVAQDDGPPRDGAYPTVFWGAGETIIDDRTFTVPDETIAGPTSVLLGLYRLEDGVRLPKEPGSPLPDAVRLAGPTVIE